MSKPMTLEEFRATRDLKNPAKGILVMDGDWLVYQAMSAAEYDASWEEEIWMRCCDHAKAREILAESIKSYASRKKAWMGATIVLAFTDRVNWRKTMVDETYKENRAVTKKPVGYFEFLESVWDDKSYMSVLEPTLEGDDVMGIIGSDSLAFGAKKAVLVSCDKDFKTIPDCDFLWCTTGNILSHDLAQADYWHMFQTIKGDITDGYGGIPGWGDTAADFLAAPYFTEQETTEIKSGKNKGQMKTQWVKREQGDKTLWECMVSIAAKAGMSEEDLLKQARMARILRSSDYIDGEIILWSP